MKKSVTLRKITVTVLMVVVSAIGGMMKVKAQLLQCVDAGVAASGFIWQNGYSCGCDGNVYASGTAAMAAGVTHFSEDSCGVLTNFHSDFTYMSSGLAYMFYDSSSFASSPEYDWFFGDGNTDHVANPTHIYSLPGYYLPYLVIFDTATTTYSYTYRIIHVDSFNTNPNLLFTYLTSINPNCNNNGSVTANIYGGNSPFTYLWSNGQTSQTAIGLGAGNYSVTVTDNLGAIAIGNYMLYADCENIVEGNIFNDLNSNCILDMGETPIQNAYVTATNGIQSYYGSPDAAGNYSINLPSSGTYDLSAGPWSSGYGTCGNLTPCSIVSITFPSVGDSLLGVNFGSIPSSNHDLGIFASWSGANPGFQMHYNLFPYDFSFTPFVGLVPLTFHYDANLVFDSSNNAQITNNSVAHTLTHIGAGAPSWYFGAPPIVCYFHVPVTLSPNYVVESDFYIGPTNNDCDTSNNHLHTSGIVTGSFDPNEKTVTPAGNITSADSVLTYNIHFQNTGNDTTHFVIVTDTLPSQLDPTTVVNLASSDPFSEFSLSGNGILKWVFNPLFLPDSASNEPASKGFVMFKVKVKPNLPLGTQIYNTASIYFDYNAPVITNTTTNNIISGISELTVNSDQLTVYPNPATDEVIINSPLSIINSLTVTDVLGRVVQSSEFKVQSALLDIGSLAEGVYFIKVQLQNGDVVVERFVKE